MINIHKNGWKNTCGFIVSIRNGSFFETEKQEGYTHFAEHLMFSGTEKISRFNLREKHHKIFNSLEARTSRDEVTIFGYFSLQDFNEAVDILSQMIYHWKCEKKNFKEEKEYIIDEIKEYEKGYLRAILSESHQFLPIYIPKTLGNVEKIKKTNFEEVKNIKKYWQNLIKNSKIDATFITDKLPKNKLLLAQEVLGVNNGLKNKTRNKKWKIKRISKIENKKCFGFWVESDFLSLKSVLLDRIFYWRWYENIDYRFDHIFFKLKNISVFYVFDQKVLESKTEAQEFLLKPIDKKEFELARRYFLKFIQEVHDVADINKSVGWIGGFDSDRYAEIKTNSLEEVYRYFKNLKFTEFKKFVDDILEMLKNKS